MSDDYSDTLPEGVSIAPVTYNFDPDRWYENQRAVLEQRRARGEIGAAELDEQLERLGERYDQMLQQLSGPFELPVKPTDGQP